MHIMTSNAMARVRQQTAVIRHFGGSSYACMSLIPQVIRSSPRMPTNSTYVPTRTTNRGVYEVQDSAAGRSWRTSNQQSSTCLNDRRCRVTEKGLCIHNKLPVYSGMEPAHANSNFHVEILDERVLQARTTPCMLAVHRTAPSSSVVSTPRLRSQLRKRPMHRIAFTHGSGWAWQPKPDVAPASQLNSTSHGQGVKLKRGQQSGAG